MKSSFLNILYSILGCVPLAVNVLYSSGESGCSCIHWGPRLDTSGSTLQETRHDSTQRSAAERERETERKNKPQHQNPTVADALQCCTSETCQNSYPYYTAHVLQIWIPESSAGRLVPQTGQSFHSRYVDFIGLLLLFCSFKVLLACGNDYC